VLTIAVIAAWCVTWRSLILVISPCCAKARSPNGRGLTIAAIDDDEPEDVLDEVEDSDE
jgi:hypothetical protein